MKRASDRGGIALLVLLCVLLSFASISVDLYLPALPKIARSLHASEEFTAWTVSGFLAGFSLTQLFWGPLADRHGRKPTLFIGLVIFCAGSIACMLASSVAALIMSRMLQAFGACAAVVIARAMVRDLYEGSQAARVLSLLMMAMALAPLLGPWIGSQILDLAGWRAIFAILAVAGGCLAVLVLRIEETLLSARRNTDPLVTQFRAYGSLWRDAAFRNPALAGACFYFGMFAYIAASPFTYIIHYGVDERTYSYLFALGVIGIVGANLINARLVVRFGARRMLCVGSGVAGMTGLAAAMSAAANIASLPSLVVLTAIFVGCAGLVIANSLSAAIDGARFRAATASALVGCMHYGSGLLGSVAVGALGPQSPVVLTGSLGLSGIAAASFALRAARALQGTAA